MAQSAQLQVELIGYTQFALPQAADNWRPAADSTGAEALVEFAGRTRYGTLENNGQRREVSSETFIRSILEIGDWELLEHATATFSINGISFAASHELLRRRDFSFTQLSQGFEQPAVVSVITPPRIQEDPELAALMNAAAENARQAYDQILGRLSNSTAADTNPIMQIRHARQAARAVLPNASETRMVMSGSWRAWRQFIAAEAKRSADDEVRRLALACLEKLKELAPQLVSDFEIQEDSHLGIRTASSPYTTGR
ncbi:FAD-dependent thymidylate synthase [Corynebacterium caspium]|uniref:FAD-dependent thymidylate synthase n=1 Tax=Corynebacterium caspium TaxID=234828 RepID=UPI0003795B0A|nr:FAD-dependent thymidylate synthase [Corynebacterium caspium]WKD59101.1 Thymidylate synthase ThyX [Corynebacterium caspium DSM 44850]